MFQQKEKPEMKSKPNLKKGSVVESINLNNLMTGNNLPLAVNKKMVVCIWLHYHFMG